MTFFNEVNSIAVLSNYVSNRGLKNIVWDHTHHLSLACIYRAEVMEQLIQSSDLFVMQVEMDVYTALKKVRETVYTLITLRYTHCIMRPVF